MRQILVYADCGVSATSLEQTIKSLQKVVPSKQYTILPCDAETLLKSTWERTTALLVIPGGRDLHYQQKLSPHGTRRIYNFVAQGGSYLGFCAGAYFAAREIEFEKGGELEVCGRRDLAFFPGCARGPAYGNGRFRYNSNAGIEAARLIGIVDGEKIACHAFFHGGCLFENPARFPHVQVLGQYANLPGTPAAIIHCRVKKGGAVLSGVHVEYSVQDNPALSKDTGAIARLLLESEEQRLRYFRACVRSLIKT